MRKGPKIIQINGYRGIFLAAFIVICLFAGFVLFPAKVATLLWNYVAANYISIPQITLWQGCLLWAMTALSIYILSNRKFAISFQQPTELSDAEMKILMDRIHMQQQAQKLNAMIMQSNDIKIIKKEIPSETEQNNDNRTDMNSDVNDKQSQQ